MNEAQSIKVKLRIQRSLRKVWMQAIKLANSNQLAEAIELYSNAFLSKLLDSSYYEASYLGIGAFDPLQFYPELRHIQQSLVNRLTSDFTSTPVSVPIGLSRRQRQDLQTYRATLTSSVFDEAKPIMKPAEIERQVNRLASAFIETRSQLIAREESSAAFHLGIALAAQQATNANPDVGITKTWLTYGDEKVRSSHSPMNGQMKPLNEPFISGNGNSLMHPHDSFAPISETSNCRCILTTSRTHYGK